MDRRDWVGIGDSSSWMGGWTPGAGWVDGQMDTTRHHHPGMGRSAIIETTARAKVIMDYGDKHQQNTETSSAFVYAQWQKQNLTDTQTTYSEIHDLCLMCVV